MATLGITGDDLEVSMDNLQIVDNTITNQAQLYDRRIDSSISHLEALPEELRRQILRYVLHTQYARLNLPHREVQGDTVTRARAFEWTIGVLRVCKTLYHDGKDILDRENKWIRVDMGFCGIGADRAWMSLVNHDVHFIRRSNAQVLTNHLATIRVTNQGDKPRPPFIARFLLPIEDVPKFAAYLAGMDITNHINYHFDIDVAREVGISVQRQLLMPFCQVTGEAFAQLLDVGAEVNATLARRLRNEMTAEIGWLRAKAWDNLDRANMLKTDGDEAFCAGEYAAAAHKYGQREAFYSAALEAHHKLKKIEKSVDNEDLQTCIACIVNEVLSKIKGNILDLDTVLRDQDRQGCCCFLNHWLSLGCDPSVMVMAASALGTGQLMLRKPRAAKETFMWALSHSSDDEDKDTYREALAIAGAYSISTESERAVDIAKLIEGLPQRPLPGPTRVPYVSDLAAAEKYICNGICRDLNMKQHPIAPHLMSHIQDGVSIRTLTQGGSPGPDILGLFPTVGTDAYSIEDLNLLEVLLYKRLHDDWRHGKRRGSAPRLCQVGHIVSDVLERNIVRTLDYRRDRLNQTAARRAALQARNGPMADEKLWIAARYNDIGHTSSTADEQQRTAILAGWADRSAESKAKFEAEVAGMVAKYYNL